jgi:Holliday junction resolvase RusA-like endonuclease
MFTITGKHYGNNVFPCLNNYLNEQGKSHFAGGKMKKDYMGIASDYIRFQLPMLQIKTPVTINYHIFEPTRKRDKSNVGAFAVKVIEDALQNCKVIPNDNWKYMKAYNVEVDYDKDNPRIEVTITALENYEV